MIDLQVEGDRGSGDCLAAKVRSIRWIVDLAKEHLRGVCQIRFVEERIETSVSYSISRLQSPEVVDEGNTNRNQKASRLDTSPLGLASPIR